LHKSEAKDQNKNLIDLEFEFGRDATEMILKIKIAIKDFIE